MAESSLDLRPLTALENLVGVQIESLQMGDGQTVEEEAAVSEPGEGRDAGQHEPLKLIDDDRDTASTSPSGVVEASEGAARLVGESDSAGVEESEAAPPEDLPGLDTQTEDPQGAALPPPSPPALTPPEAPTASEAEQSSVENVENSGENQVTESEPMVVERAWTEAEEKEQQEEPSPAGGSGGSDEMLVQEPEAMVEGAGDSSASSGGGEGSVSGTGAPVTEDQFTWDTVHCVFCDSSVLDQEPKLLPCLHSACNKCLTHEAAEPEMNKDEDIVASEFAIYQAPYPCCHPKHCVPAISCAVTSLCTTHHPSCHLHCMVAVILPFEPLPVIPCNHTSPHYKKSNPKREFFFNLLMS